MGFSTKFLKEGSLFDIFKSTKWDNIPSMWRVFWLNIPPTKYVIELVKKDHDDRMKELQKFVKDAKSHDWYLKTAGQRVQIVKRDQKEGGVLELGTEVIYTKDGRIIALLGALVAVDSIIELIHFA